MTSYLIGIDHKRTPLKVRETAYRMREEIARFWEGANPGKTAMLVTCNRIEIYGVTGSKNSAAAMIRDFQKAFQQFKNAYKYYGGHGIFRHGLRLACGLESQLPGEYQILEQIEGWIRSEGFPRHILGILEKAVEISKAIRAEAGLDKGAVDLASLLFHRLKREMPLNRRRRVIVIGTGKIAELVAKKVPDSVKLSFVARKKRAKAERLARIAHGEALLPEELPVRLVDADSVISATSSAHYVLKKIHFKEALKARRRLLCIYDVAVPADAAPGVASIPFVRLVSLNGLIRAFNKKDNPFSARLKTAAKLVEKHAAGYKEPADGDIIRIGTRPSALAYKQIEEIKALLPHVHFRTVTIETTGDRDKYTPLGAVEKSDFFTGDIEDALIEGRIDAALHSAKDIEERPPEELCVAAMTSSISPCECLVSRGNRALDELPAGAVIGTSSRNRRDAVKKYRGDLVVKEIRGNVDDRIAQLDRGDFDAIIVAHAALIRLGYEDRIAEMISPEVIEPHPLQGRLAVQVRRDRRDMYNTFRCIHEA